MPRCLLTPSDRPQFVVLRDEHDVHRAVIVQNTVEASQLIARWFFPVSRPVDPVTGKTRGASYLPLTALFSDPRFAARTWEP